MTSTCYLGAVFLLVAVLRGAAFRFGAALRLDAFLPLLAMRQQPPRMMLRASTDRPEPIEARGPDEPRTDGVAMGWEARKPVG